MHMRRASRPLDAPADTYALRTREGHVDTIICGIPSSLVSRKALHDTFESLATSACVVQDVLRTRGAHALHSASVDSSTSPPQPQRPSNQQPIANASTGNPCRKTSGHKPASLEGMRPVRYPHVSTLCLQGKTPRAKCIPEFHAPPSSPPGYHYTTTTDNSPLSIIPEPLQV